MRTLGFYAIAALLALVGARCGLVTYDDAGLREDVVFVPQLLGARVVNAKNIADTVVERAQAHGCEVTPNGIEVDVQASQVAPLRVAGASASMAGPPMPSQLIDITLSCRRRGALFFKQTLVTTLRTQASGEGTANHYPPRTDEDRNPHGIDDRPRAPPKRPAPTEPQPPSDPLPSSR